jgi:hypothetical protein
LRSTPRVSSVCVISSVEAYCVVPRSLSALLSQDASDVLIDVQDALVQEADVQLALVHEADVHDALVHEALVHEALVQEADIQLALVHEASVHEALVQDASAFAALVQLAASNTGTEPPVGSATTNLFRARFGFGGFVSAAALAASSSPTPSAIGDAEVGLAVSMRAPLTWSGVQFGCSASRIAAAPETTGAANDVPESSM